MKKQLLFTAMIAIGTAAYAQFPQCNPANYPTNVGLSTHPDSAWVYPDALPIAETGQPYYEVIYFKFQEHVTTVIGGSTVTLNFDSAEITNVTGLPSGFSRKTNKSPLADVFDGGEIGCLAVYGTSNVSDLYNPILDLTIYVSTPPPFTTSFTEDTVIDDFVLVVTDTVDYPPLSIVEGISSKSISFYPNPADRQFYVSLESSKNEAVFFTVTNLLGEEVLSNRWNITSGSNKMLVDVTNLQEGVYIYSMFVDGKKVAGKITVTH